MVPMIPSDQHTPWLSIHKNVGNPTFSELSPSTAILELPELTLVFLCSSQGGRLRKCWFLSFSSHEAVFIR